MLAFFDLVGLAGFFPAVLLTTFELDFDLGLTPKVNFPPVFDAVLGVFFVAGLSPNLSPNCVLDFTGFLSPPRNLLLAPSIAELTSIPSSNVLFYSLKQSQFWLFPNLRVPL